MKTKLNLLPQQLCQLAHLLAARHLKNDAVVFDGEAFGLDVVRIDEHAFPQDGDLIAFRFGRFATNVDEDQYNLFFQF